jgi:hypothetical protein
MDKIDKIELMLRVVGTSVKFLGGAILGFGAVDGAFWAFTKLAEADNKQLQAEVREIESEAQADKVARKRHGEIVENRDDSIYDEEVIRWR